MQFLAILDNPIGMDKPFKGNEPNSMNMFGPPNWRNAVMPQRVRVLLAVCVCFKLGVDHTHSCVL